MIEPLISVIIPTFNNENTIERCLTSVCNQTIKELEIIVVNDGSTDQTRAKVEEFIQKDSRIKLINQENSGQGLSRNAGLKIATGQTIGFVDADDLVDENMYFTLLDALIKNNADVAQCNIRRAGNPNGFLDMKDEVVKLLSDRADYFEQYIFKPKHSYECTNKLIKKSFLEKNDIIFYSNSVVFAEDLLFNLDIALYLNTIVFVNLPLYHYSESPNSHSSVIHLDKPEKFFHLFEIFIGHAKSAGLYDALKDSIAKIAILICMINLSHIISETGGYETAKDLLKRKDLKQYIKTVLCSDELRQKGLMLLLLYLPLSLKIKLIHRHYSKW